jgi:hypothetical protein
MKGYIKVGSMIMFQFETFTRENGEINCTGKLTVYASKLARNPIRPFTIHLEEQPPYKIYGIILKCTSRELQIKEI